MPHEKVLKWSHLAIRILNKNISWINRVYFQNGVMTWKKKSIDMMYHINRSKEKAVWPSEWM